MAVKAKKSIKSKVEHRWRKVSRKDVDVTADDRVEEHKAAAVEVVEVARENIRQAITISGLPDAQVARMSGMDRSTLLRAIGALRDGSFPRVDNMLRIALVVGIEPAQLFRKLEWGNE